MPGKFQDKNGANLAGHSDRWSNSNRRSASHDAGQGSRGSRNQGTGLAGKANTMPSDAVDTSTMSKEEKLKYFNALGLMPKVEPEQPPAPKQENPVKVLSAKLGQIFSSHPQMINDIVKALQGLPKEQLKQKSLAILDLMSNNTSTNPTEVHGAIMNVLNDKVDNDLQSIKDFFYKAGKEERKRVEDVDGLIGRFIERSGNNPEKIKKAKDALDAAMSQYVAGEQSRYIAGMNAAFGALK